MALADIQTFLARHRDSRIALVTHPRPDGDALGSTLGLASALRGTGYRAVVVNALPVYQKLRFLITPDALREDSRPDWYRDYDCLGVLDCGDRDRLDPVNRPASDALPTFTIDHHASSQGLGEARWINPAASSVGEMVVQLCLASGWRLDPMAAEALWTAILTDTGRFSYSNATPAALDAARHCLEAGADPQRVSLNLYQSFSQAERRLQARVLTRLLFLESGRLAISWLAWEDYREIGVTPGETQELVSLVRDTDGVEVAVYFYEVPDVAGGTPSIKVSMRTAYPHDALRVVCRFGGGGHARAAGCTLSLPMGEAKAMVIAATQEAYFSDPKREETPADPLPPLRPSSAAIC